MQPKSPLSGGVWSATPTPLNKDKSLDEASIGRLRPDWPQDPAKLDRYEKANDPDTKLP